MSAEYIKIKFNVSLLKWGLTIFFLCGNLFAFASGTCRSQSDWNLLIIILILSNCLAGVSFLLLSIFPRWYYVFDENGVTFYKRGKAKKTIKWVNVVHAHYNFAFDLIFEGLQLKYIGSLKTETLIICIKQKDIIKVCQAIPVFDNITHGKYLN